MCLNQTLKALSYQLTLLTAISSLYSWIELNSFLILIFNLTYVTCGRGNYMKLVDIWSWSKLDTNLYIVISYIYLIYLLERRTGLNLLTRSTLRPLFNKQCRKFELLLPRTVTAARPLQFPFDRLTSGLALTICKPGQMFLIEDYVVD